jgi:translation initiation factor IF-2
MEIMTRTRRASTMPLSSAAPSAAAAPSEAPEAAPSEAPAAAPSEAPAAAPTETAKEEDGAQTGVAQLSRPAGKPPVPRVGRKAAEKPSNDENGARPASGKPAGPASKQPLAPKLAAKEAGAAPRRALGKLDGNAASVAPGGGGLKAAAGKRQLNHPKSFAAGVEML